MNSKVKDVKQGQRLILRLTAQPEVTLSDIARLAGCSLSFVSACAHGRKRPSERVRNAAEKLFSRSADELFAPLRDGSE